MSDSFCRHLCFACASWLLIACAPHEGGGGASPPVAADGAVAPPPSPADAGPSSTPPQPSDGGFDECVAASAQAEVRTLPVDIVWVVDNSASMGNEAQMVRDNMNAFAEALTGSGVDHHVVLVGERSFIEVPPPLGVDPEHFLHVEERVGSREGLSELRDRLPDYQHFLRDGSKLHFVAVTDDNSEIEWESFRADMEAALGRSFTLHAIVSEIGTRPECERFPEFCEGIEVACEGPHGRAARPGHEYIALAEATGGLFLSICHPDWSELFGRLTDAIARTTTLPCRFGVPEPPDGMTLDRDLVNVVHHRGDGVEEVLPRVTDPGECDGAGWYYEGEDIVTCPLSCDQLTESEGRVDIAFGCETVTLI